MHECADGIRLRDPKGPLPPEWFGIIAVVFAVPVFGQALYFCYLAFGVPGLIGALVVEAAATAVAVLLIGRAYRRELTTGPRLAGILCPHGVQLTDPVSAGRLLAWPEIAEIRLIRVGLRTVAVLRLVRWDDRTGLPQASRIVEHRAVPDDPAWLWLGFVPTFRVGRTRAAAETWTTTGR